MRTIKLTLAYDGTNYVGWQRQARGTSIQGLLETALAVIEGHAVVVTGSGRTDAGAHALAQVASFDIEHPIAPPALVGALNARLPADVRALAAEEVEATFNARYAAHGKTYRYRVFAGPILDPFERLRAWHVPVPLDAGAMRDGLRDVVGRHDFGAFRASGSAVATTTRTMVRATLEVGAGGDGGAGGEILAFEFTADGFLRHMVRSIVGTLVEIGAGRCRPDVVATLLRTRDRRLAGPTAPACGLFLVRVHYGGPASPGDLEVGR